MFERRLKWIAFVFILCGVGLAARLYELQISRAAEFETLATRMVTRPERLLPGPRGAILDRAGRVLVSDEPAFDVSIHYGVLAARADYLTACARELRRRGDFPTTQPLAQVVDAVRIQIGEMWQELAETTRTPLADILDRADAVRDRVEQVREAVRRRSPTVERLDLEDMMFPVVEALDNDTALAVRLRLEKYPWLRVVPASRRVLREADELAHLIGRTGATSREHMENDPLADNELRKLRPGDRTGTSGVERAADVVLRGTHGRIVEGADRAAADQLDPQPGGDVVLTIDLELQRGILQILGDAVEHSIHPTGGAAVVMDPQTREILALVSYPTFEVATFSQNYPQLVADTRRNPLLFRAVAAQYAPGSICKAVTLIGGLSEGVITENTRIHCNGKYLPNNPNAFRCWIYNQNPGVTHDMSFPAGQIAEDAVRNSCNIYFFTVGDKLGAERLCSWFSRAGMGRTQGSGLTEEVTGIVPNEMWLRRRYGRGHQPSDAWNFSIGQGEVTCTPLQAANISATIVTGKWAPVVLIKDAEGRPLATDETRTVTFDENVLHPLRCGMWRVVNERGGTAYGARLDRNGYELCGKTGSAQAVPNVTARKYIFEWPDGRRDEVIATSESEARSAFEEDQPALVGTRVAERFPAIGPEDKLPSHAWFMGYTQSAQTRRGAPPTGRVYSIAVIVEFGGSGGKVAGPVAKRIAEFLYDRDNAAETTE